MGVPSYFKNIILKYNEILISQDIFTKNIHNLFFDLNCLIHPTIHNLTDENEMNQNIYNNILKIINICKPTKLVYLGIDGVCPRAKIEQQRKRRFKSVLEKKVWDTNAITPGTKFMNNLNDFLNKQKFPIKTIISDSSIKGEGEHKIMDYLKKCGKNDVNIVYGLDADLIHLSLIRTNNIYLLRERTEYNIEKIDSEYIFLDINSLKKYLLSDIKKDFVKIPKQDIINDYIFMCFFIGNDFIHNTPSINIRYNGLDHLLNTYNKLQKDYEGIFQLIEDGNINLDNFKLFINELTIHENDRLKDILHIRNKQESKMKHIFSNIYNDYNKNNSLNNYPEEHVNDFKNHLPIIDRREEKVVFNDMNNYNIKYYMFNKYLHHNYNPSYDDILQLEINEVCKNYLESIVWTANYYFKGCISWTFYYKYHYSPLLNDFNEYLKDIENLDIIDRVDKSLDPKEQLLLVLPLKSINLNNNLKKEDYYYPKEFYNNTFMKRYSWEGNPVLPE